MIALVVTIIVLLILAGVTITAVLGEDGIIEKAKEAKRQTEAAIEAQEQDMADLLNEIEGIMGGETPDPTPPEITIELDQEKGFIKKGSNLTINATVTPSSKTVEWESSDTTVASVENGVVKGNNIGRATITAKVGEKRAECIVKVAANGNEELKDENENKYTVPDNFTIVPDGIDNVEYKYATKTPKAPTVQDGIVIEDEEGNQFVWIPVGTIKNKAGETETTTITLGRYTTFADGEEPDTMGTTIQDYYTEDTSTSHNSSYRNAIAKNIDAFKSSATTQGGYYLARYEASYGGQNKPLSKPSTGSPATRSGESYAPRTDSQKGQLWNNITQPFAAIAARNMYSSESFTSDLTNSYAWDTAIVFIQKYSGDKDYSEENGQTFSSELRNTGAGETASNTDKVCNIYDMASNCLEWTTETYSNTNHPCVSRGGSCNYSNDCASNRSSYVTSSAYSGSSFRPVLYVNQ